MTVHNILNKLQGVKRSGSGWTAQCVGHKDSRNSLSISQGDDGRVLLYCHAGCSTEKVCAALGIELKDLIMESSNQSRIVQTYDYRDESSVLLYQNCRFEPKDFRQRQPDGNGGWMWKLNGVRRIPYRLPELLNSADDTAYLVEGEKDVDNLAALGLTVTSLKNWRPEFNPFLIRFQKVIILQDHDKSGIKQATDAAHIIHGCVTTLKIVDLFANEPLPDKYGKDVSDWLAAGGTVDQLQIIIESASEFTLKDAKDSPQIITSFSELMSKGFGDGEEIAFHACRGELVLIQSVTNHCKSTLTRNAALALSTGGQFLSVVKGGTPHRVLLLNLEGAGGRFQSDLRLMTRDLPEAEMSLIRENFFPTHAPLVDDEPLSLSRHADLLEAEAGDRQVDVVIVDTASAAFSIRNENDNSEVANYVMKRLVKLARRLNCLVVLVHHIGKAKSEEGQAREQAHRGRGASAWADFSTSIFNLEVDATDKNRVTLTCGKRKDGENYETVLRLDRESRWLRLTEDTPTRPTTNDDIVLAAMREVGAREMQTAEIEKMLSGKIERRTAMNCLNRLADRGLVEKVRHGWWVVIEVCESCETPYRGFHNCTNEGEDAKACVGSDLQANLVPASSQATVTPITRPCVACRQPMPPARSRETFDLCASCDDRSHDELLTDLPTAEAPPPGFEWRSIEGVPVLIAQNDMEVF